MWTYCLAFVLLDCLNNYNNNILFFFIFFFINVCECVCVCVSSGMALFLNDRPIRWHCIKSSDCQVRVGGAPWNYYGVNVTKAVIGAYMWQWWPVQILWHLTCVFSSFCCLMNYYTVTFATCWYVGWVKILQLIFCVNLTVATVNFLLVAKMICDSMFSWTFCKWEVPHCMQV